MSQAQFDSLDESNKQTFLQKQLWIRDNFEVGWLRVSLFSFFLVFSALAAARPNADRGRLATKTTTSFVSP